ncbi:MAG: hypothetical protein ABSD38_28685 [Syntrophorhabdales bacterium]|jgi:hypothetical protein
MSLVIPTASSTYGDSTITEGAPLVRKHVLAQFRSDADLEWVRRLRAVLATEELKYINLREARPKLKRDKDLWHRVESGVAQATVVVIDPDPIEAEIRTSLKREKLTAQDGFDERAIIENCATAIIARTPVAYLPYELFHAVPWGTYYPIGSLEDFAPETIKMQIGGGLRHAMLFSARAHAIFDLQSLDSSVSTTWDIFRSPLARVCFAELLSTERTFDQENPRTIQVLNKMADEIASAIGEQLPLAGQLTTAPLVKEVDSRAIDELQAADIAAGWAREILETNEAVTLGQRFERVWINGRRIK